MVVRHGQVGRGEGESVLSREGLDKGRKSRDDGWGCCSGADGDVVVVGVVDDVVGMVAVVAGRWRGWWW